jgi:hypothetical protein
MWECPGCLYLNEDPDELCARCANPRIPPAAAEPAAPDAAATVITAAVPTQPRPLAAPVPPAKPAAPRKHRSKSAPVAVSIIFISLLLLGGLGYLAYSTGRLDDLLGRLSPRSSGIAGTDATTAPELEPDDPLQQVIEARARGIRSYRKVATALRDSRSELDHLEELIVTAAAGDAWSGQAPATAPTDPNLPQPAGSQQSALPQLSAYTETQVQAYTDFAALCGRSDAPALEPYKTILFDEFVAQFERLIGAIGRVYSVDQQGQDPAYLLPDRIAAAVRPQSEEAADKLKQGWMDFTEMRRQLLLDEQYQDYYNQLQARIDAVREVRDQFDAAGKELQNYSLRAGTLTPGASTLLDILDKLSDSIEVLVLDFESYCASLPADASSDRLEQLKEQFTTDAQAQHFFAFDQVYRIYVEDRELSHPAYARLAEHLAFVKEHWPRLEGQYRRTYELNEALWAEKWAK